MPGYHIAKIERGEYGKLSKIREEFEELCDAVNQGCTVMALCELADMMGAIRAWLERNAPGFTLGDLIVMADATDRAFKDGTRKPRT